MRRTPPISEATMLAAEQRIPQLAAQAGRAAHQRALAKQGRVVMKSATGQLVERQANGEVRVIKSLPASTPVQRGLVLKRMKPSAGPSGQR